MTFLRSDISDKSHISEMASAKQSVRKVIVGEMTQTLRSTYNTVKFTMLGYKDIANDCIFP